MKAGRAFGLVVSAWVCLVAVGCQAELQHGLSEPEANELLVLLATRGIAANKARDTQGEGWMVLVAEAEQSRAWRAMEQAGLPRRAARGFEAIYPRSGLLPSPDEERVMLQAATSGELERSLQHIEGVLDARVHLVLPPRARLRPPGQADPPARASVLLRVKPERGDMDPSKIAALVSGAVDGLASGDVEVLIDPAAPAPQVEGATFESLGPIKVAPGSTGPLRWFIGALVLLILLGSGALIFTLFKLRRLRQRDPSCGAAPFRSAAG